MLITNARILNEGRIQEGDVLIQQGRIAKIAPHITVPAGHVVCDAQGKLLMPGMIDDQVHFRTPGLTHKGTLTSESAAAVAGGITSFMDMPNTIPNTTTREALDAKYAMAIGQSYGNYAFHFGAANDNLEEVKRLRPGDVPAVKIFMGASTGNMLVDNPATLEGIFRECKLPLLTHCEDTPLIKEAEAAARARWGDDVPFAEHPRIRSHAACYHSTELAVRLARQHGAHLHVLHLTTADEMQFFAPGPMAGKKITAEVCVHHLCMNESLYATRGALIKCNPAVKSEVDRLALVKALAEDRIDIIATDHAPHTLAEKGQNYWKSPSGLPLVQHALPMLFGRVADGELTLTQMVQKACHNPAERFGVRERGYIREGYWADLVMVEDKPLTVHRRDVLYHCGFSPSEGDTLPVRIHTTWVNGEIAYHGGKVAPQRWGQRLALDVRTR